jgi:hypothetical protein
MYLWGGGCLWVRKTTRTILILDQSRVVRAYCWWSGGTEAGAHSVWRKTKAERMVRMTLQVWASPEDIPNFSDWPRQAERHQVICSIFGSFPCSSLLLSWRAPSIKDQIQLLLTENPNHLRQDVFLFHMQAKASYGSLSHQGTAKKGLHLRVMAWAQRKLPCHIACFHWSDNMVPYPLCFQQIICPLTLQTILREKLSKAVRVEDTFSTPPLS